MLGAATNWAFARIGATVCVVSAGTAVSAALGMAAARDLIARK